VDSFWKACGLYGFLSLEYCRDCKLDKEPGDLGSDAVPTSRMLLCFATGELIEDPGDLGNDANPPAGKLCGNVRYGVFGVGCVGCV